MRKDLKRKVGKVGKKMDEKCKEVIRELEKMRNSWERERKEINNKVEELGEKMKKMELQERRIEEVNKIGRKQNRKGGKRRKCKAGGK